jgi:carbon starvation protein
MAIGPAAGTAASLAILFIVVIALAGLGVVVVKALGGEEIKLAPGTRIEPPAGRPMELVETDRLAVRCPANTRLVYPNGVAVVRNDQFTLRMARADEMPRPSSGAPLRISSGAVELIRGSSWGTFTIASTIPIALMVGLYMYKIRKGRVLEASLLGAVGVLAATVAGNWIPGSSWEPWFSLSREATILSICIYGFVASVLPVWLLLCPRDYLSSFLKIGTVGVLIFGVLVANPRLEAPAVNSYFSGGGGPYFSGAVFPFVFICIMCGAISGFHALVSSGTTPKMISRESHVRTIGYGAMLIEGIVGVVALIAAASLPQGDYWAINIDLSKMDQYAQTLERMGAAQDNLPQIERQVGGESLRGRTGGAVTLAVGMARILSDTTDRLSRGTVQLDAVIKYWYHFAIMFEALFILTTIDTGTRIARFLLHEALGKVYAPLDRVDWLPGAVLCTGLVTAAWGGLIWTGSIETIWPMFGIANQLLAAIALCVVTTVLFAEGRGRYAAITLLPLAFVTMTTLVAAYQMLTGKFLETFLLGLRDHRMALILQGGLNIGCTLFLLGCFLWILVAGIERWTSLVRVVETVTDTSRR